jgi:CRP-like cAMP-binding protein
METLFTLIDKFWPVSADVKLTLQKILHREALPRKHWLLQPGHISDRIYFIEQGVIRGFYLKAGGQGDGRDVTSWFMREQDFIVSILSFYTRQPAHEYIELLEDSIVWSITYAQLQQLYRDFPEFNAIGRLLTEKYYVLSERRTQNLRMQTAPERYQQLLTDFPAIFQRVPLKYIASHLGISPETVSRLRGQRN